MRHIIYVDGSVGVGKSTFIKVLEDTFRSVLHITRSVGQSVCRPNVDVLPEPLHRNWTPAIVGTLGYDALLKFLLARKKAAIEAWSAGIASDGMQELEANILIVERSMLGDRRVRRDCEEEFTDISVNDMGEHPHYVFIKNFEIKNDEQDRLNVLYNSLEVGRSGRTSASVFRIQRPRNVSNYHIEAAAIVNKVLNL